MVRVSKAQDFSRFTLIPNSWRALYSSPWMTTPPSRRFAHIHLELPTGRWAIG